MSKVWEVLSRRPARPLHPPMWWQAVPEISPEDSDLVAEEKRESKQRQCRDIQAAALAQVIPLAFRVVVHPKYWEMLTPKDIEKSRKRLCSDIYTLRRLAKTSIYVEYLLKEEALLQAAMATLPGFDHPLVSQRLRGDRASKGVLIQIAQLLNERFEISPGSKTAATLAAVALGVDHLSERPARSALRPAKRTR